MDYISSADQQILSERYHKTRLVVVALGLSVLLYLLIGWLISPAPLSPGLASKGRFFYFAALVIGFAAVMVRRLLLSRLRLDVATRRGVKAVVNNLGSASIIGGACGEMVGVIGLVAYLMTGDAEYNWRLGVIGLLLIAYSFPRRGEWERAVSAIAQRE